MKESFDQQVTQRPEASAMSPRQTRHCGGMSQSRLHLPARLRPWEMCMSVRAAMLYCIMESGMGLD